MKSLKDRLTKNVLIISLLFYVFVIGFNVYFFNSFGRDFVRTRLEHDTETIISALKKDPATNHYQIQHLYSLIWSVSDIFSSLIIPPFKLNFNCIA
jgi:hypothetical protein